MQKRTMNQAVAAFRMKKGTVVGAAQLRNWPFMIAIAPDPEHLSDLRVVRLQRGTPRVPAVRTGEKGKRRHGDYAIGVALAHFATRGKWVEYGYRAIGGRGQAREENWLGQSVGGEDLWWRSPLGAGFRGSL